MTALSLNINNLSISFGGLHVLKNVSFDVPAGSIVSLIGPNGAGKTTVFNLLTGVYEPTSGQIQLGNASILGLSSNKICERGMTRTFQNIRLFKDLSVLSNVLVAKHIHFNYSLFGVLFRTPSFVKQEAWARQEATELLKLFGLEERLHEKARNLPYGEQRKLEMVRALATGAKVLLLDEPAAGMNEHETHELLKLIQRIKLEFNTTILLIEHDMKLVMNISDKIVVLNYGEVIASGPPMMVKKDPRVIEAYLGAST